MKVLLICDDIWHPAEIIERGLKSMDWEEMEFDIVKTAKDVLSPEFVRRYDVLVNCHGSSINASNSNPWFEPTVTEFGPEEFRDYVAAGGALVVVHSGLTVGGRNHPQPAYTEVVGSYFLGHPLREMTHVQITQKNEITAGVEDFSERDEHYQIAVTAKDIEPFMKTTSEHGGTFISGYRRTFGKGRVVALTPGHTLAVWVNPNFQKLFKNAIRWAVNR